MSSPEFTQPPIVVGYDPGSLDRAAVSFGVAAARFTGAPLIVTSVCRPSEPAAQAEDLAPEAEQPLRDLQADLDVPVEVREVRGSSAARALHELADAEDAGMLVVGSTDRGAVGRVLPGSTAERLMHGAPCPIAVVPRGWEPRGKIDPIGVAYLPTDEGLEALRSGYALARKAGSRLRVLTAVRPGEGTMAETETYEAGQAGTDVADLEGAHRVRAEQAARRAVDELDGGSVPVEIDGFVDDAADALVRVSEHLDVLVCGSRGYGPLRAVLLGGVSRRLVTEARCPVIVLPRGVKAPLDALTAAPGTIAAP